HIDHIQDCSLSDNGKLAVTGSKDQSLRLWDLSNGDCLDVFQGHTGALTGVAVNESGRFAVSSSVDGTLKVWDLASGPAPTPLAGHESPVRGVLFTPDGERAVSFTTVQFEGAAGSFPVVKKVPVRSSGESDWAQQYTSPRVWDTAAGACLQTLKGHRCPVETMAIAPNSRIAVSICGWHGQFFSK